MDILLLLVEALKLGTVLITDIEQILDQAKTEGWQGPIEPKVEQRTEDTLVKLEATLK